MDKDTLEYVGQHVSNFLLVFFSLKTILKNSEKYHLENLAAKQATLMSRVHSWEIMHAS